MITTPLFHDDTVRLTAFELEPDAAAYARWSHDPRFLAQTVPGVPQPLSAWHARQRIEGWQKANDDLDAVHLAIRRVGDPELIGVLSFYELVKLFGTAKITLGIGDPAHRGQRLGGAALRLGLRYAFDEQGLHLLIAVLGAHNSGAARFFERHGFRETARRREACQYMNKRWDELSLVALAAEWRQ